MPDKQTEARIEKYNESGEEVVWPELTCIYLFNYLMMIGPATNTGMGQAVISWQELESWQKQNGVSLNPWELSIIRKASAAYVHQSQVSTDVNCPPPGKVVEKDQNKLAQHIKSILR